MRMLIPCKWYYLQFALLSRKFKINLSPFIINAFLLMIYVLTLKKKI